MRSTRKPGERFKGQTVLVTGSGQGIGMVTAMRFAEEGAQVAVVARRDLAKAQSVVDRIKAAGGVAQAFTCNVRRVAEIQALVSAVVDAFGTIDILFNNAGADYATPMGTTREADYDRMQESNLKGTFFVMNSVVPIMKEKQSGKIINMTAMLVDVPVARMGLYCATKAAIGMLTRCMAWELAPHGINCNAIAPGNTITKEHQKIFDNPAYADVVDYFVSRTPARKRKWSGPEDIAEAVLFLASEEADGMYGTTLVFDEGMSQGWSGVTSNGRPLIPDEVMDKD
jgi:3-oxoacyl-[acyl-carrier protein] reductase